MPVRSLEDPSNVKNYHPKGLFKRFVSYYKPHKKLFVLDMLASFFISAIGLLYPIVTQLMFKTYIPNADYFMIAVFCGVILVLYIIRMLLRYFVQYQGHVMGTLMQAQMRKDMFEHLEKLPYSFYDNHETGRIMSRMTNDLQDVSELAHHGPENFFISGFMVVGTFVYLMCLNVYLTLIIFATVPFLCMFVWKMRKGMARAFMESRRSIASINASMENSITGIRVTKAFNNASEEEKKFAKSNVSYLKARSKAYKAMGKFSSSTSFLTDFLNLCVLGFGALFMANDIISADVLVGFLLSINVFINPLTTLINFTEQYQNGVTGFKRFAQIMDTKIEEDTPGSIELADVKGEVEFKDVHFTYNEKKEVLNGVSFKLQPGEKFALVGSSGGGKTTICHLLPRFYKISQGEILIDGKNINDVTMESLRKNIGIVQQDVLLFSGTIKENIAYGKLDASDEEIIEASKKARLYDYIKELPNGFDTDIGERGVKLSGGQKQRLSIARIFLKDPKILILDEATSALDNTTEFLIQEALDELAKNRTTIVVAHRLSTIKNAEKIAVVAKGKIVEIGSHEELVKVKNGIYRSLYLAQYRLDEQQKILSEMGLEG